MKPVEQFSSIVAGVTVYQDLDKLNAFFLPKLQLTALGEQDLGAKRILQGSIKYDITNAERAAIAAHFPNSQLGPIAVTDATIKDPFEHILLNHTYKFRVLPQIPYPTAVFSATLNTAAADYQSVLDAIRAGWAADGLLSNCLTLKVPLRSVDLLFYLDLDNKQIKTLRENDLPASMLTFNDISEYCSHLVTSNAITLDVDLGGNYARRLALGKAITYVHHIHFAKSFTGQAFDDCDAVELFEQQPLLSTNPKYRCRCVKSTEVERGMQV